MGFINKPIKTIGAVVQSSSGAQSLPWANIVDYPVTPGETAPTPIPKDFIWELVFVVTTQIHSAVSSRSPGKYTGMDVSVGQWIADSTSGQAWQIIEVREKTDTQVRVLVQDVYRYNTFRDPSGIGRADPLPGYFIIFNLSDSGIPQIDPVPEFGVSSSFAQNLNSRFEYINTQYDFALYQENNTFQEGDVIAADNDTNTFLLADGSHRVVLGRVTSISNEKPGWFTINPVQKIVDFLDYLPGDIGDIVYYDGADLTLDATGPQVYVVLRKHTPSRTTGKHPTPPSAGDVLQINGVNITFTSDDMMTAVSDINLHTPDTGVAADTAVAAKSVYSGYITSIYGETALFAASSPATAQINGVTVVFDITATDPGYEEYARAAQMADAINRANIPDITASSPALTDLVITNSAGGEINITDQTPDINGVYFAGPDSGAAIPTYTPANTDGVLRLTAVDARAINLLDVVGEPTVTLGIVSVENGVKAAGMYIRDGLRSARTTVVADLQQLGALEPIAGDGAFVIDSTDQLGNNSGEWSMWVYDGAIWVKTSTHDSATTDARSLEATIAHDTAEDIVVGNISTGRRITLITVDVTEQFDSDATLAIGYSIASAADENTGSLMTPETIDLTTPGVYTGSSSILFGTDTPTGDVTINAKYIGNGATTGAAQIIVSYL